MEKHDRRPGSLLIVAGLLLILSALLLTIYNLWDDQRASTVTHQILEQLSAPTAPPPQPEEVEELEAEDLPDYMLDPNMEMPAEKINGYAYIGTLELPTLNLPLPVMSEWSYPRLKISPCRYSGSAYQGNLIIAAHNYSTHFGKIATLTPGDAVIFTDIDGNRFSYEVAETQILQPTDVEEMVTGDWDLTLFTCTLGGQTRVTVRCAELG